MDNNQASVVHDDTVKFLEYFGGADAPQTFQLLKEPKDGAGFNKMLHGSLSELAAELKAANHNGCGVFFTPNQTDGQGRRQNNIIGVRAVFIDLDGAPIEPLLEATLPPHIVVESSPGRYHAYYMSADCPLTQFTPVQKALAAKFGGDVVVCDLPRLMRVPGFTHNKGTPFLSRIIHSNNAQSYTLDELISGLDLNLKTPVQRAVANPSTNAQNTLPALSTSKIFQDGGRTVELTKKLGRFYAQEMEPSDVLPLIRDWNQRQCSPPLDDAKLIHTAESIYRTVQRRQNPVDPFMDEMNQEFAVVMQGSKIVILRELPGCEPVFMTTVDFKALVANRESPDGRNAANYFMRSKHRREYNEVIFDPSNQHRADQYNLYSGFAVEPDPHGSCQLLLQHILEVLCAGSQTHTDYLLDWMADAVQNPAKLPGVAVAFLGGQGTGKGLFVNYFGAIFGRHYQPIQSADMIVGKHVSHLAHGLLVFADEAMFQGGANVAGSLKNLITEPERMVNPKGKDMFTVRNFVRLIIASNNQRALPADVDDRRFYPLRPSEHRQGDFDYFGALTTECGNGGPAALLHYLLNRDISQRELRNIPQTSCLIEQKLASLELEDKWLYERLCAGELVGHSTWPIQIAKKELFNHYRDWLPPNRVHLADMSLFHKRIQAILPVKERRPDGKERHYTLPDLEASRRAFERHVGGEVDW